MRRWKTVVAGVLTLAMSLTFAGTSFSGKAAEESGKKVETPSRVTVHDPSIIKADGMYYVFGSHMADAKSTNLIDWKQINTDWNARETSDAWKQDSIYGDVLKNYAKSFEWAGYDDGDCSNGRLAIWAPDVIYNPYYKLCIFYLAPFLHRICGCKNSRGTVQLCGYSDLFRFF